MQTTIDWRIHVVYPTPELPEHIRNNHTHDLGRYNHLNFQVLLALSEEEIGRLLNTMGLHVQAGERFSAGDMVKGLYDDCEVRLDLVRETGRDVLRLIIPDMNNRFPEDPLCEAPYKYQTGNYFEEPTDD